MTSTLSAHEQAMSIAAATAMFSQCSIEDENDDALKRMVANLNRRYSSNADGSHIQRRNAVGNLFEGVDLAFIKQLTTSAPIQLQ
ncbi:unnamed protein product [Anisakis simplex]|uniref:Uncharacterized protein n=1 Tax=Anisakis simplex TaxID=6269 RepID=A0A0M3IYR8_ANISI|nr:unnamed protein product [Anisakis simplex]